MYLNGIKRELPIIFGIRAVEDTRKRKTRTKGNVNGATPSATEREKTGRKRLRKLIPLGASGPVVPDSDSSREDKREDKREEDVESQSRSSASSSDSSTS